MINSFTFANPAEMHDTMCKKFFAGRYGTDFDWAQGTEVGLHNVTIGCETIDFDANLKDLWIPPSRWSMMVRQYIDPFALDDNLAKIEERMAPPRRSGDRRGIAVLRTRLVQGKGTGRGVRRRWGSCMLNLSFRHSPVPTVTLNSRTTYFGYLALVDVAVARAYAARCAEITGIPLSSIQFVWRLDLAQFHGFRSLAWVLGNDKRRALMDKHIENRLGWPSRQVEGNRIGFRKAMDGYARIKKSDDAGTLYGDESFSSFARVRRRFHTEVFGEEYAEQFIGGTRNGGGKKGFPPLPDTFVRDLDLSPLNGRSGDSSWFDHDEGIESDDDEDDDE